MALDLGLSSTLLLSALTVAASGQPVRRCGWNTGGRNLGLYTGDLYTRLGTWHGARTALYPP